MITSNTKKPFGGKVATIETPTFSCFISTAKEGFFQKQSMLIYDTTSGFSNRQLAAKLVYNDWLDSNARLGLHDTIIHTIDESGMNGITLLETLQALLVGLHEEGVGIPEIDQAWWNSNIKKIDSSLTSEAAQKSLLTMELFTSSALLMIPASNYETDSTHMKRVLVFLFGAFDAVVQGNKINGQAKFDMLEAYLKHTFPSIPPNEIQATVTFLCEASSDPAWIPLMERGGQTLVDWARGDFSTPSRLVMLMHHGMEGNQPPPGG